MSAVHFAKGVLAEIDQAVDTMISHLAKGTPQDHARYREMVGEIRGLQVAREAVTKRFSREERDTFHMEPSTDV